MVVREQPQTNDLLERLGFIPVAANLDAINELLNENQRRADLQNRQYLVYLSLCAALMVLWVLYLILRQLRSHALINQMNSALQAANERLEQRVEERTRELRETQSELMSTARAAGMAEIATNVLHNVGNVLNSVNVSAQVLYDKVRAFKGQGVARVVQLMKEHPDDLGDFINHDPRGRALPDYLAKLADALVLEQQAMIDELAQLTKSIEHIRDIVTTQQSYAGNSSMLEWQLQHAGVGFASGVDRGCGTHLRRLPGPPSDNAGQGVQRYSDDGVGQAQGAADSDQSDQQRQAGA